MRVLRSIVLLALFGAAIVPLRSQTALPTRLVQAGDLVHQGSFTIPNMQEAEVHSSGMRLDCEYAQGVITFNPANNSLFLVCHDWSQSVAEIGIPGMGGTASVLQAPREALGGRIGQINPGDPNSKKIGGLHVIGDRLVVAAYSFYDGSGSATSSHFVRSVNLGSSGVTGPFRVGSLNPAFYAGYFAPIPTAWQGALGGAVLNGQCCLSIISRTSFGPSVSVVNPSDLTAGVNGTPATMLVGYPEAHQTLAGWSSTGPLFNGTTLVRGVLLPEGTASVLFFGRHGMGAFCYGEGSECGDPEDSSKGNHAYPYEPRVWAYNANDLAAVRAGQKQPWDVKPYATWRLPAAFKGSRVSGVATDPATGRIFIAENYGDGAKPRIHVFSISGSAAPVADTTPPSVSLVAPTAGTTVQGTTTVSASASDNAGVASVWVTVDGAPTGQEDTTAPYQIAWDTKTVSNGTHNLRAVARDVAGNVSSSAPVAVTVGNPTADTTAPSVSLSAPAAGASVSGTATVSASASDNVGVTSVQFTLNGVNLGSPDTTAPYGISWNTTGAANGTHTLRAVARDAAGNVTTSAARSVTVSNQSADATAPTVSLSAPAAGAAVSGTVAVSATASDSVGVSSVQFTLNGVNLGAADTSAPYTISWNTTSAANGTHVLGAVARDAAGNARTAASRTVTVSNTTTAPPPTGNTVTVSTITQLQSAITNLVSNRTILIAAGTYTIQGEALFVPQNLTNITIAGATGKHEDVIIQGAGMAGSTRFGFWVDKVDGITFRDLTIRNIREHAVIINCSANAPVYRNVRVVDIGDQFIKHNPGSNGCGVSGGLVEDSVFEYSTRAPDDYTNGIDVHQGAAWTIRRNTFRNFNTANGLVGPAVLVWNASSGTVVENNTFIDNARDISLGLDPTKPGQAPVSNGALTDHRGGRISGNSITRRTGLAGADAAIYVADSPGTVIENNQVRLNGTYPNAIEYRFPRTTGVAIRNNGVDGGIVARDGATASVSGTTTPGTPAPAPTPEPTPTPTPAPTPPSTDTARPTVSITSPGNGQRVSGTITIRASASDNVGVTSVQFSVDGVNIGSADTTAPYTISWNTASVGNGSRVIRATARDAAGNTSTASITVNVSNRTSRRWW
jgi:hypothetical protein